MYGQVKGVQLLLKQNARVALRLHKVFDAPKVNSVVHSEDQCSIKNFVTYKSPHSRADTGAANPAPMLQGVDDL